MRCYSLFIFILCFSFLSKAAENPDKYMRKGRAMLFNSEELNEKGAYRNFMKAHELQSKDADLYLGLFLFFGIGTEEDRPQAISYMEKASEHGDQCINILLGFCYYYGLYVERVEAKAFHYWIEKGESHNRRVGFLIEEYLFEKPWKSTVSGHVAVKENFCPVMDYIHSVERERKRHYNRIWMQKDKYGNLWVDYSVHWLDKPTEEKIIKNITLSEAYCYDQGVLNIIEGDSTYFESCSDTTIIERQWDTPSNGIDALPLCHCGGIGILKDGHFYVVDKKTWSLAVNFLDVTPSHMVPKGQPIPSWLKSKIYKFMRSYLNK